MTAGIARAAECQHLAGPPVFWRAGRRAAWSKLFGGKMFSSRMGVAQLVEQGTKGFASFPLSPPKSYLILSIGLSHVGVNATVLLGHIASGCAPAGSLLQNLAVLTRTAFATTTRRAQPNPNCQPFRQIGLYHSMLAAVGVTRNPGGRSPKIRQ
jgi:hypothetical protein